MKGLINNLAMLCLITSTTGLAQAQSSIVEYPGLNRKFAAPVIIENNESTDEFVPATRQPVSGVASLRKTPYFVEFGSVSQPVSLQPPTIRPSGTSPHIQEFSVSPLVDLESAGSTYSSVATQITGKAHTYSGRKNLKAAQNSALSHKSAHSNLHRASAQLVAVDKLAIFPIYDRQSANVSLHNSSNLLSGKSRPSM